MAERPPRLAFVFEKYPRPLWFVTFNTAGRAPLLAVPSIHAAFLDFAAEGAKRGIAVGRYVLMPDHVHLFVAGPASFRLTQWVRMLKLTLSTTISRSGTLWQEGFFDHLIRGDESYAEKWEYVRANPVRAGLAGRPEDWPFQGEIHSIQFH